MAQTIDQSYISQFKGNIHMLMEQKGSKLKGVLPVEVAKGEKHFFERLGNFTASEVIGRLEVTNLQDPDHSRRMATVRRYHASTYLDDIDKFKLLIDPMSEYATKLANAHGKKFDTVVIDAILGAAATGKEGSGSEAFDTANQQIAHGSGGLTVAKFNQALRILEGNEVDIETAGLVLLVGARGREDLLGDSSNQLTSFDYQGGKVMDSGKFPMFRGVRIIHTERITDETAGTTFRALLLSPDAVKIAMSQDLVVKTAELPNHHFSQQISTYMMYGAVRMEESRVVDILYQ